VNAIPAHAADRPRSSHTPVRVALESLSTMRWNPCLPSAGIITWIITTELNRFAWPGPDIRPTASGDYIYGYLPEKLMHLVLAQVRRHADKKELKTMPRTE